MLITTNCCGKDWNSVLSTCILDIKQKTNRHKGPFSWDNAIDADQNATETVRVDYLKLKLKWILN